MAARWSDVTSDQLAPGIRAPKTPWLPHNIRSCLLSYSTILFRRFLSLLRMQSRT